jgi:hypothetical protein
MKRNNKISPQDSQENTNSQTSKPKTSSEPKKKKTEEHDYVRDLPDPPEGWHLHGGFYDFE